MNLPPVLRQRYLDSDGEPLINGKLFTYQAGTTTPQVTYTDATGLTPNTNPIILNSNGEAAMWLDPTLSYKFVLKDSNNIVQWTTDGVIGSLTVDSVGTTAIQDGAVTADKIEDGAVGFTKLADNVFGPSTQLNCGLAVSIGSNAMVITLKTLDGGVPNVLSPIRMGFRSATATSGLALLRDVTSAISLTVPSGATLGGSNGVEQSLYVLALDNAGTVELAIAGSIPDFGEGSLISTTGIDASADTSGTIYSNNARTNVPFRVLGRIKSTQATAGTWTTTPSEISIALNGWETWSSPLGQQISSSCGNYSTSSTTLVSVTNLSVTLTTRGRPVWIGLVDSAIADADASYISFSTSIGTGFADVRFQRNSTDITRSLFATSGAAGTIFLPVSDLSHIDFPAAGTSTYVLKVLVNGGGSGNAFALRSAKLVAYEL